jgi:hypothetical protein
MHWMLGQPFNHQDSRSQRITGKDSPLPTIAVSGNAHPRSLENSVYERHAPLRHSSCDPGSQCSHVQGKRICACLKALRPSHSGFLAPDRLRCLENSKALCNRFYESASHDEQPFPQFVRRTRPACRHDRRCGYTHKDHRDACKAWNPMTMDSGIKSFSSRRRLRACFRL